MARFCETCGNALSPNAGFCSSCGSKSGGSPAHSSGSSGAAVQPAPIREEKVMLNELGITVTSARFITNGQTYAMNGITSVKSSVFYPSKFWPIVMILIGVVVVLGGLSQIDQGGVIAVLLGIGIVALGILWLRSKKPVYSVRLTSASGEAEAYSSRDGDFVGSIVNAINDAIVHRG